MIYEVPGFWGLSAAKLVVVTGKGGVGKTTVAATLASVAVRRGMRVLLLEADPRESLHQLLGCEPSGGQTVRVEHDLWLENVAPSRVLDRLVSDKVPIKALGAKITAHPIYLSFVETFPGIKEMAVLGRAWRAIHKPSAIGEIDLVILDAPASGHGLSLLRSPALVCEAISSGPIGSMAADLRRFVSKQETKVVIATTLEEMPIDETAELIEGLARHLDLVPALVVANQVYPKLDHQSFEGDAYELWRERRTLAEAQRQRLEELWRGDILELPLLPYCRSPELLDCLIVETERIEASESSVAEVIRA